MKNITSFTVIVLTILLSAQSVIKVDLPQVETVDLAAYTTFDFAEIDESSAIVKSRFWDNVYWTLNDSGSLNKIYPVNSQGEILRAEWYNQNEGGIFVANAANVDWEDMTTDAEGNLYISDLGNNGNARRDLVIYQVKDPYPEFTGITTACKEYRVNYPNQKKFPAANKNFDCEAIFWANDSLFVLSKHREDTYTTIYQVDTSQKQSELIPLETFDIGGMVTAAEANDDGSKLAVLTYNSVWIFKKENTSYFQGKISWLPIKAKQCEAICFQNNETLMITNEQREIFLLPVSKLYEIK
jgi:hypothetical protein